MRVTIAHRALAISLVLAMSAAAQERKQLNWSVAPVGPLVRPMDGALSKTEL